MKKVSKYQNTKILVLGLAKSGVAAAKLLFELGAFVTVNDAKKLEENPAAQELLELGMTVITGSHPTDLLDEGFSLIVKNPGIPYTNPILQQAKTKSIPVITEIELAYDVSEAPIIGITGTNGKTTTTTMIANILNYHRTKGKALLAGNIGFPASDVATKATTADVMVTELSSFQLLGTIDFKPTIAVITNLFEAHIDYHGTREDYVAAKWRLQKNMTADNFLILNYNQDEIRQLAKKTEATVVPFCTNGLTVEGAYLLDKKLYFKEDYIMDVADLGVPGMHNVENALAAIAVAKLLGTPTDAIRVALCQFSGVKHRTEFIGVFDGKKVYNDSKATNMLATEKALSGFNNQELVLIAGGLDRGNDFDDLLPYLRGLKAVVLTGETKHKLQKTCQEAGITEIILVDTMQEAVSQAMRLASENDNILLSPACASWDQYKTFEERGDCFVSEVQEYVGRLTK
ncbi:UDP-N-acetylmuramoyl-L-alanine--D-glutamate ligase [Vagococcus penaei]|uniref:UDP-N-acetylmuramoylalanine--D-glutamate ligase n=1 Tax=Vagococcus penaei TaxID=633807 RepID=A0A1Q2D7Y5_9ENTE|nr:UDP-N-acetylmuramoyl-L-alanine--D-glutamate ligase [Vagococcus penaei]AQP54420.1 UDP-N-acetylmuramoyl-L-alanine--D-glutamate ligase [Vagococcus penaei]RSU06337.1 UDP-N-acetylmuramoyl-L-alanine--D-glutamate ligase [Vagococcus penaei]